MSEPQSIHEGKTKSLGESFDDDCDYLHDYAYSMKSIGSEFDKDRINEAVVKMGVGLQNPMTFNNAASALWAIGRLAPGKQEEGDLTDSGRVGLRALQVASDNFDIFKRRTLDRDTDYGFWIAELCFEKKVYLLEPKIVDKAVDFLRGCKDQVKKSLFEGTLKARSIIKYYSRYLPEEFDGWVKELETDFAKKGDENRIEMTLYALTTPETLPSLAKIYRNILQKEFQLSNFDANDIIKAWRASDKKDDLRHGILSNLNCMYWLRKRQPDAIGYLHEKFGISCFGRYPREMLLEQYETRNNKDDLYGLIIYPYADHNGAFYNSGVLGDFYDELVDIKRPDGQGYTVKVFECKNLFSVGKAIVSLFRNHGPINFAIIGGHGRPNKIWFNDNESLSKQDILKGKGIQRTVEFFALGAPIVLISCSTGEEGGIAEEMAKLSGGEVSAPKQASSVQSISVHFTDGELQFEVEYDMADTAKYKQPRPNV